MSNEPTIKKPVPNRARGVFGTIAYGLVLASSLAVGSGLGLIKQSKVGGAVLDFLIHPKPPQEVFKGDTNLTLLILGCDQDIDEHTKKVIRKQARSDMMLVANLDFANNRITGVSIPRDTICDLPGYKKSRINAYHSIAPKGQEASLTQAAVEHLLPGVHIDRVLTIDYDEFEKMVDMVGGVSLNVEKDLDYDDNAGRLHIHIKEGPQALTGEQAIGYVRYRHGDSDFERQKRQKHLLVAFKDQLIRHWTQIGHVADQAGHALGDTLSPVEIASIALFAKGVKPDNIQMGMVPVTDGRGTTLVIDEDKIDGVLKKFNVVQPAMKESGSNKGQADN